MANKDIKIQIKAVNKTRRAFMAVTAGLGGIAKAAFSMKTAIGLAAGALGIGFLIKRSMDATDELAKTARAIGLSVTELQRFQYAAELGGVESKALNKAMQKLAINISDVAGGTGEAKDAFERYGISAKNADGSTRSVSDVMGQAATALEGMTNKTDRASFVYDLFGARGAKVINMLQDGKDAMEAMMAEADRLGLVMSGALIQGVEDANDAILRLTSYLGNVFHRVVATLAPVIQSATDALRNFIEMKINKSGGIAEFSKDIARSVLEAAKSIIVASTQMLNTLTNIATGAGRAIQSVLTMLPASMGGLKTLKELNAEILIQTNRVRKLSEETSAAVRTREASLANAKEQLAILQEQIDLGEYLMEIQPFSKFDTSGAVGEIDKLISKLNEAAVSTTELPDSSVTTVDLMAMTNSQLIDLQDGYQAMAEGKAFDHQRKMNDLTHQYLAKQSAMQKAAKVKDFGDLQEGGRNTLNILGGHYKAAFDLNKTFAIKDALINTYKSVSTALASAPFPINIGMAGLALLNGMAQVQSIRGTQFRANGGPISAGSPYIVGERGPELVVPNQAASVVPNDQLGGGNYTINISANDTAGFDELLTKRRGMIMGLMNQALNERGRPALA